MAAGRLRELQQTLGQARQRLGALADRLTRLRLRVDSGAGRPPGAVERDLPFGGAESGAIEDRELTFQAVDIDQDKMP